MKTINMFTIIKSELSKYRKSPALILTIGAPLFLGVIVFLIFFFKADKIIASPEASTQEYFIGSMNFLSLLIPLYLILLNVFVFNIEYKSNSFKTLFTLPINRNSIIAAKFIVIVLMFFFAALMFQILLLIGFNLNSLKYAELFVFDDIFFWRSCVALLQMVCVSLLVLAMQFYFSFKWKNVVTAISLGMMGFLSYIILIQGWKYIVYHPYAFPTLAIKSFNPQNAMVVNQLWFSIAGMFVIIAVVLFDVQKRKIVD